MTRVPAAVLALLDPASWQGIRSAFLDVTLGSPASTLLILLVVGALYAAGRPAGRHLRSLAEKTQHRFTDNIGLTFRAMGWSLLRVLPAPVLLMAIALRLRQIPETAPGVEIIASAAFNGAIWWLAGHLVALFISRNGVGTVHFGWNPCMVRRLRRNLAWYLPIQFILIVGLALAFGHPSDLVFDVLGRAALVASGVMTGALAWRLLAPNADLHRALSGSVRRLVRIAAISYAAGLVILALAGYLLTVSTLFERTIYTAVVVVGVWLGYRLAMRALILSEMRLRVRRMLEQRAKAAAADGGDAAADGAAEVPEPALSIEDINLQTRALVKVVAGGIMVLALFGVWANVLPALAWLDSVTLWTRSVKVGATEVVSQVSLQDALLALFLIVLSGIAARNLPGLVEIILTRSTRMDAAGRYTVTTLLRYLIMIAAVISVFSLLGLRWSQLQWMVAALTLGLGFGLQEVVANFVSGLIMLFERPARVGDLVTIGEYTGTVAKIRTRATTIIDGDNREVLVPNKMFITERLINWTLSDTMTRIVVPIGVSYDTDVDLVKATLQQIAEQNPLLMKDPAPSVFFTKISASTFDFELRGYVKLLRDRLEAMSTLQAAIVNEFRRLGIDMAFPQMDLHIRDLPAAQSVVPAKAPAAKTAS
jgi:potassium efflux system protein